MNGIYAHGSGKLREVTNEERKVNGYLSKTGNKNGG
jgi:hypothetical protein